MRYDPRRITELLETQGRTIAWLADRTGYDRSTVSRFLNGQYPISEKFAVLAAGWLQVPVAWLAVVDEVQAA